MLLFHQVISFQEAFTFTFHRWYAFVELAAVCINLALVFFVLRTAMNNQAARWYALFGLCLSVWGVSQFLGRISTSAEQSILWGHLGVPGWVFMSVVFFTFTLYYTRRESLLYRFIKPFILFLPALFFAYLAWNTEAIVTHDPTQSDLYWYGWDSAARPYFWIFIVWLEFYFWSAFVLLFLHLRRLEDSTERRQTLFIIVGLFTPLIIGSITDAVFPILGKDFPETAILFTTVLAMFVGFAILKYKLFYISPESILSSIVDTMTEALIVLTPKGYIAKINRAALDLLDYKNEELVNQHVKKVIRSGKTWDTFEERALLPLYQGKPVKNLETTMVTREGKEISVNFSASLLKSKRNDITLIVAVANDITQTKDLILKLQETARELTLSKYELERRLSQMTNIE